PFPTPQLDDSAPRPALYVITQQPKGRLLDERSYFFSISSDRSAQERSWSEAPAAAVAARIRRQRRRSVLARAIPGRAFYDCQRPGADRVTAYVLRLVQPRVHSGGNHRQSGRGRERPPDDSQIHW